LSTTNPTWPDPGLKPGRRGGRPATNRLSYGAAIRNVNKSCIRGLGPIWRNIPEIGFCLKKNVLYLSVESARFHSDNSVAWCFASVLQTYRSPPESLCVCFRCLTFLVTKFGKYTQIWHASGLQTK
jgi:hypothetical protein